MMRTLVRRRAAALICPAVFLLCVLISHPWAEIGIDDDWSFIRSAQALAQTGHIVYFGWAEPIIGWQLYLGALFLKVFGFSFTAARIPTLLIAMATAYLMQRTLVRLGLSEGNATFGTLTFVVSPLFLQLAPTMMTDLPGFFSLLACLYGCLRALKSIRDRDAILWLCFAVGVNAICGTSRQIAWLGILVLVPCTLWLMRSRRIVLRYGSAVTVCGFTFVAAALYWFHVQPYALQATPVFLPTGYQAWRITFAKALGSVMESSPYLAPLLVPFLAFSRCFSRRNYLYMGTFVVAFLGVMSLLGRRALPILIVPLFNHRAADILANGWVMLTVSLALLCIAMMGLFCAATTIVSARPTPLRSQPEDLFGWTELAVLLVPLATIYYVLICRSWYLEMYSRYLLLPVFLELACLLLYSQQHLKPRWKVASYVVLTALGAKGVIETHNTFSAARARAVLIQEVLSAGVPASHADFGWDMDGWYELQSSRSLNNPSIIRPQGFYTPVRYPDLPGCRTREPVPGLYPHLAARYGFYDRADACDGPAPFAPVQYSVWPRVKPATLYVVKYPPPWRPESDYAVPAAKGGS